MTTVALLALQDCQISSLSGMSAILLLANNLNRKAGGRHPEFTWQVLSLTGGTVATGSHITVASDAALGEAVHDIVWVPPLYYSNWESFLRLLEAQRPLYGWLRNQWEHGATLAASGTGTFLVAETGLLNGCRATTAHWLTDRFRRRYPEIRLQKTLITEDRRLICSAASTTYLRMAQRLIDLFMGRQIAAACARTLLHDAGFSGEETQIPTYVEPALHSPLITLINDWAEHRLSDGSGVEDLARHLAMSVRSLHRHMLKETGQTPAAYLQQRRMEAARRLLESTDFSILEVAQRVGYSDNSAFTRVFTRSFGLAPARYRLQQRRKLS